MVSAEQGGGSFIGAELQSSRVDEQQIAYKSKMAESSKAAAQLSAAAEYQSSRVEQQYSSNTAAE